MGDVISLSERRVALRPESAAPAEGAPRAQRTTFWFDLALPETYLAAERVDRLFAGVRWVPAASESLHAGAPLADDDEREAAMERAADRAATLSVPLVWPETFGADVRPPCGPPSPRAASAAARRSCSPPVRLAFCGGFDLADPEVLAEAAAAAAVPLDPCLAAAGDVALDGPLETQGRGCSPWAPTGCPRCGSAARSSRARTGSRRRSPPRAPRGHGAAAPADGLHGAAT